MTPQAVQLALGGCGFWHSVHVFEAVGSTIDTLKQMAEDGAPEGTVAIALEQRAGRGRAGRSWTSPRGGLWMSALFRPQFELPQAGCVSVYSSVALAEALAAEYGLPMRVKWPNDVWVLDKKLIGVLAEIAVQDQSIEWLMVSVGANVNNPAPSDARTPATSLSNEVGRELALEQVAAILLKALAQSYQTFVAQGFGPFIERWEKLSALTDVVAYERNGQSHTASVTGLGNDGKLIVNSEIGQEFLAAEEVSLLTPTS